MKFLGKSFFVSIDPVVSGVITDLGLQSTEEFDARMTELFHAYVAMPKLDGLYSQEGVSLLPHTVSPATTPSYLNDHPQGETQEPVGSKKPSKEKKKHQVRQRAPYTKHPKASEFPHLVDAWHHTNTRAPEQVTLGSNYKAILFCPKNSSHPIRKTVLRFMAHENPCLLCRSPDSMQAYKTARTYETAISAPRKKSKST